MSQGITSSISNSSGGGGTATTTRAGQTTLSNNTTTKAITFSTDIGTSSYAIVAQIVNTTDGTPQFQPITITAQSSTGFTATWNGATDSANYVLDWVATANV